MPYKEDAFYSHLNIKGITYAAYRRAKNMHKKFEINNLGDYHDFYVQNYTLRILDIFENVRNKFYMNLIRLI